jgi:hypothetical protein
VIPETSGPLTVLIDNDEGPITPANFNTFIGFWMIGLAGSMTRSTSALRNSNPSPHSQPPQPQVRTDSPGRLRYVKA